MSNYLSQPIEVQPVQSSLNIPLMEKALAMRQGKYDANKSKAEQTLAQYGQILKAQRPEDNEYLAAKLNDLSSAIKEAGDLSLSSNSDNVMSRINAVYKDPIIRAGALERAKKDKLDADYAERVKKGDGSADQLNYKFALEQGGYQDYMDGKTKSMGSLNYTPYYDESKEFTDISENLNKYVTDVERTTRHSGGYIYTQKGKSLTEDKVKQLTASLLSDKAKRQMSINAWGAYDKGANDEEKLTNVITEFKRFKDTEFTDIDSKIEDAKLKVKNKDAEQSDLDALISYKKELGDRYTDWEKSGNRAGMYTRMYSENKLNAFSKAHAINGVFETYSADSAFSAAEDLKYKMNKDAYDAAHTGSGKAPKIEDSIQTKSDPDFKPNSEETDWTSKQEQLIGGLNKVLDVSTNDVYSKLDADTQKDVDNRVKNSKGALTKTDVLINLGSSSTNIVSASDYKMLTQVRLEKALNQQTLNKYTEKARQEADATLDSDSVVKDLYNNPNVKIMWRGSDGKERLYSAKDVLINNKIIGSDGSVQAKMSSKSGLLDAVKKSMLADKILSSPSSYDYNTYIKQLASAFGENISDVTVSGKQTYANYTGSMGAFQGASGATSKWNPKSKTANFIENHRKMGGHDKGYSNDSFDDLSSMNSYLAGTDPQKIRKRVGEFLANDQTLAIGKITTVDPKSPAFSKLASQAGNINVSTGYSIEIKRDPSQPNMVKVSQYTGVSDANPTGRTKEVSLKISELAPEITRQIDLQNTKQFLTVKSIPDIKQKVKYGNIDSRSSIKDIAETHFGGVQGVKMAEQTTTDGALEALFSVRPEVTGTEEAPTEIGLLVKKIISDNSLLVTLTKGSSNDAYPTVLRKVGNTEKTVFKSTDWVDDSNIQAAHDRIFYTPQLIVNGFIAEILQSKNPSKLKELYGE
jgi:hypothetical protein